MVKETIAIKLQKEEWGDFWKALISSGEPVSCVEDGNTYLISRNQAMILQKKGIDFQEVSLAPRSKV
jgi:hypothetical protein